MGFSEGMEEGAGLMFGLYAGKKMVDWTFSEKPAKRKRTKRAKRKITKRK
jgi:hypothetical protein